MINDSFSNNEDENFYHKIIFPEFSSIQDLKIKFEENYDKLLLLECEIGLHDTNSYVSKIAFIKNNQLFVFMEYDNPEHCSYYTFICNENNFYDDNFISCKDFFKEALSLKLASTLSVKNNSKRTKI